MGMAYTIATAALAVSVRKSTIVTAIQSGELVARRMDGTAIILSTDIQAWLSDQPNYLDGLTTG